MKRALGWFSFVLVPLLLGSVAFFLSAKVTSSVRGLVLAALLANALAAFGIARLLTRRWAIAAPLATFAFATLGYLMLFRRPTPMVPPVGDRGVVFERWSLASGSNVAVARLGPGTSKTPIVFLHGGPGRPVFASDVTFFRSVAEKGLDVVLYDQMGVGESDALDPRQQSVARSVADLEAIRVKLGVEKLVLVGQSWGGRLAYEYVARHPTRVESTIFFSGAPLSSDPAEWKFDERRTALAKGGAKMFPPMLVAAMFLAKVNVDAALSFASKEEINHAFVTQVLPMVMRRVVCEGDAPADHGPPPGGLDSTQLLTLRQQLEREPAPAVVAAPPPALVVRPWCDFLHWRASRDYRDRSRGRMVIIPEVGHSVWPKKSAVARDLIVAFVRGEPLPLPTYAGADEPTAP